MLHLTTVKSFCCCQVYEGELIKVHYLIWDVLWIWNLRLDKLSWGCLGKISCWEGLEKILWKFWIFLEKCHWKIKLINQVKEWGSKWFSTRLNFFLQQKLGGCQFLQERSLTTAAKAATARIFLRKNADTGRSWWRGPKSKVNDNFFALMMFPNEQ